MTPRRRLPSPNTGRADRAAPAGRLDPTLVRALSRRRFLGGLGGLGAAGVLGLGACSAGSLPGTERAAEPTGGLGLDPRSDRGAAPGSAGPVGRVLPGAVDDRVLVIVDLHGGNDGLSTLVPAGDGRYHDLRPNLAVPDDEVLALDDEVGLHPSLTRLHARGLTTVEGVGPIDGDLSHFAMTERWERGDADGANALRSGFLGRLADALDDSSPLVAVSLAGPTPHLINERAATMSLSGPDELWFLEPTDWAEAIAFQEGLAAFDGGDDPLTSRVVDGYRDLERLAADLGDVSGEELDWDSPMLAEGGDLGHQLHAAADLIAAGTGVRVVYTGLGDFDTHSDHPWRQADNLTQLDAAVDGFLGRAADLGIEDRVLVATISEFGRRVPENDGGLDHGAGSTMLVAGPVGDRRLGERPDLGALDDDDNLAVTIGFDRYLAGLAEGWLGVEAASVLPGEPEPIDLLG